MYWKTKDLIVEIDLDSRFKMIMTMSMTNAKKKHL